MCVLFISLNKHYLELVMMYNKYWKFILSKCSGFTKQIYKWESIFFNLCNNLMMWEMTNGARKAMTGHAGGQRAVKRENWNPAFLAPVLVLSQLLCKSRSPFTSYTKMHGRRKKKKTLSQYGNKLRIHFKLLNKELRYRKVQHFAYTANIFFYVEEKV